MKNRFIINITDLIKGSLFPSYHRFYKLWSLSSAPNFTFPLWFYDVSLFLDPFLIPVFQSFP